MNISLWLGLFDDGHTVTSQQPNSSRSRRPTPNLRITYWEQVTSELKDAECVYFVCVWVCVCARGGLHGNNDGKLSLGTPGCTTKRKKEQQAMKTL